MSRDISSPYEYFKVNPIKFGKFYFSNHFRDVSPEFHFKILSESYRNRFFAVQAPRGSAKSTILSFLKPTHSICFKLKRFIIIVQNTYKKSVGTLEGIKDEIRWNEKLRRDFGIELEKDAEGDTIFRHKDGYRTRVLCKGVEQIGAVRGERFGAFRPDYIIGDDMEDDEMVKSIERRQGLKDLFNNALIPAGDVKYLDVDIIGTILHDDSLMAELVSLDKYKQYRKLFYMARFKEEGVIKSLWPERWTVDELDEFERNNPEAFAKEMQGDPSSGSLETIRREDFRYWKIENNEILLLNIDNSIKSRYALNSCRAAIGTDLAWEEKKASDFSAIVPGLITPGSDLCIDDYIIKKGLRPDELEEILFSMTKRYELLTGKRVCIGFEKAKLEKVSKWFLAEAQRRRNEWLWIKDIDWGTKDKIERVLNRLGNRYSQHAIYHKTGMGDLENQLVRLRSAAHDDLADAVGMLPEMLQFAPKKKKEAPKNDIFKFLQNNIRGFKEKPSSEYQFGIKQREDIITRPALPV